MRTPTRPEQPTSSVRREPRLQRSYTAASISVQGAGCDRETREQSKKKVFMPASPSPHPRSGPAEADRPSGASGGRFPSFTSRQGLLRRSRDAAGCSADTSGNSTPSPSIERVMIAATSARVTHLWSAGIPTTAPTACSCSAASSRTRPGTPTSACAPRDRRARTSSSSPAARAVPGSAAAAPSSRR